MLSTRSCLTLALALGATACARSAASVAPASAAPPRAVEPAADELRRDLYAFAADSMRGRDTGTPDADRAAAFLAARLATLGVEPAGDSGFFQRVPMTRTRMVASQLTLTGPAGPRQLALGRDLAVAGSLGPGAPMPKLEADADVVFAGYGIVDPGLKRDDLAGLDLSDKVVVVVADAPPGVDSATRSRLSGPSGLIGRLQTLLTRRVGAAVVLLPDSVFALAASEFGGTQIALGTAATGGNRVLPMVVVAPMRTASGPSPFLPSAWPTSDRPVANTGTHFTAKVADQREAFNGYNVVGIVRGSDPALRGTYVAYGAHYDHVGVGTPVDGDSIYNGADDDGSGSTTLLALARSWSTGPRPKRSALFVWHVGEEKGLLGSQYFTDHPTVPVDSIVAQLNADMIGRNGPDSLYIVGPNAAPNGQSRVLGALVDSANASLAKPFTFDRTWDSPSHPERIYFRSDHFNYARKGVPIIFFTTGLHPQYHKPSDEASLIDYEKMARVGQLMYRTGVIVANRAQRPK